MDISIRQTTKVSVGRISLGVPFVPEGKDCVYIKVEGKPIIEHISGHCVVVKLFEIKKPEKEVDPNAPTPIIHSKPALGSMVHLPDRTPADILQFAGVPEMKVKPCY